MTDTTITADPIVTTAPEIEPAKGADLGGIGPITTNLVGIGTSVGVGLLLASTAASAWHGAFPNIDQSWDFIPWLLTVGLSFDLIYVTGLGKDRKVETGHKGVLEVLDERRTKPLLREGSHWLPRGLASLIPRDVRLTVVEDIVVEAASKNNIMMRALFSYEREIENPYLSLSTKDPEKAVATIVLSITRAFFGEHTSGQLMELGTEGKKDWHDKLKKEVDKHDGSYGINVTKFFEPEILPPKEVLDAFARVEKEMANRKADTVVAGTVEKLVQKFVLGDPEDPNSVKINPELAFEYVMAMLGKVPTTRQKFGFDGLADPAKQIAEVLIAWREAKAAATATA